ncbi:MAG TPA: FtsK/SpoIIIE domain-containing protein [Ktedonobacteraceae bacterium]|nr:FtsK/SpoIIIE domain-containing protein [Ktedonobacteraceae bacterium]
MQQTYHTKPTATSSGRGNFSSSASASASASLPPSESFNRPPRIVTAPPQGTVSVPEPPDKDALPPSQGWISLVMPMIMMAVILVMYIIINHGSMQEVTFLLPMALFSIMSPITAMLTTRQKIKQVRKRWNEGDKKYRKALSKLRKQLTAYTKKQREVALLTDPDPEELEVRIHERAHLWERRPEDPDFLAVRVGKGKLPLTVTLKTPEIDVTEPMLTEVQQLRDDFLGVKDIPCRVSLPKVKSLGITGRRQDVAALTRGMLCQIATHHSPEDVRIFGLYPASQQDDWNWLAQLPHTMPLKSVKQGLPIQSGNAAIASSSAQPGRKEERLVAVGEDEANILLNVLLEELSQRASKNADSGEKDSDEIALPHFVVVIHDYVDVRKHPALTHAFKLGKELGVSVIYMVAAEQAIPSECRGVIRLSDEGLVTYAAAGFDGETFDEVSADKIELEMAQHIATALAPLHVAQDEDDVDLTTNVRLLDLLDIPYVDQYDPEKWWGLPAQSGNAANGSGSAQPDWKESAPRFGRLRVPIGEGLDGPVWIDLNDAAHGPHGIIAGTTGAGKSELLQSLIVGLAVTHHPHLVNFVLVDFKGGAAFKAFENMPHTVGMVTDLSGKLSERALVALKSELKRREHILSQANAKKIAEYQAMRAQQPSAYEPLPNLFIVIDEFAELAKEHPTFMEGLVSVVQKGRSLGVHLILATQKPTGSVNQNIWSNLKFRICLRVASLQDSRDMLGRSEAALLPSTIPGRAYFQIGSEIFDLFQSARTSMQARVVNEAIIAQKQKTTGAGEVTDLSLLIDAMAPYKETLGATLFRPWPEPLPQRIDLPTVYRRVEAAGAYTRTVVEQGQPPFGWLTCPIGLVDLPIEQRQEPFLLDLPRNGGHVLIGGASGSGKSVLLRTLITSLIKTHSPAQLNLYLIDYGGQALRVFEKLPHVGGVFGEPDDEYIRRLLRKLHGMIEERKQFCAAHQIDDFLAYQRRRLENTDLPELPAVVLVIDKFSEFKQAHDKEMDVLLSIARFGRTYGVYLVLTIDRPVAVPPQLLSLFELRFGLRLVELTDSLILLGKHDAAHLEATLPGRAYKRGKILEELQVALPVAAEDDDEQTRKLDEMVTLIARITKSTAIPSAPPIRLLPDYVRADYFLMAAISNKQESAGTFTQPTPVSKVRITKTQLIATSKQLEETERNGLRIRLGMEDFSLSPFAIDLNADTPHMLVAGGPGSGRTSAIQTSLLMLACSPENRHARVMLVDFRRSSRLLRRLPNLWMYADTEERLVQCVDALKQEMRERMARLRTLLEQQEDSDDIPCLEEDPVVLVIDDYDQFSILSKNPLLDLKEFLLQARDLRLHIIVAGAPSDLSRSDALLQQVRACRLGLILGGDPQDQPLLGVRISDMSPGRGTVVRRNQRYLVQVAHLDTKTMTPWLARLRQSQVVEKIAAPVVAEPIAAVPEDNIVDALTEDQQLLEEAKRITDATLASSMLKND